MLPDAFYKSALVMRELTNEPFLADIALGDDHSSAGARVLRHGLSVTAFASLELFLIRSITDFMTNISGSQISYDMQSEAFRQFVTIEALNGLSNAINLNKKSEKLIFAEAEIPNIAKYLGDPRLFSGYGFRPRGSNIKADYIQNAFKAIGFRDVWRKLTEFTRTIGFARANLEQDFKNLAESRHSSAHNPVGAIASSDLVTNINVSVLIAVSVSAHLDLAARSYRASRNLDELNRQLNNPAFRFRYIERRPRNRWCELDVDGRRGVKVYTTLQDALHGAAGRRHRLPIIVREASRLPISFHST